MKTYFNKRLPTKQVTSLIDQQQGQATRKKHDGRGRSMVDSIGYEYGGQDRSMEDWTVDMSIVDRIQA